MNATNPANSSTINPGTIPSGTPPSRSLLPDAVLVQAMEAALENETRMRKQIEEMQRLLAATQEEASILAKLVALRSGESQSLADNPTSEAIAAPLTPARTSANLGRNVLDAVIEILEQAKRPVHISDLMRLLSEGKVTIPGAGTQANLISHLRRDNRIVRPSRGMYGLAALGLKEMAVQTSRRRKRRRRK